jgi:ribosomal protein S17E
MNELIIRNICVKQTATSLIEIFNHLFSTQQPTPDQDVFPYFPAVFILRFLDRHSNEQYKNPIDKKQKIKIENFPKWRHNQKIIDTASVTIRSINSKFDHNNTILKKSGKKK